MSEHHEGSYYLPHPSAWPLIASFGLFCMLFGAASWIHILWFGPYMVMTGAAVLIIVMFGWFGTVIHENQKGLYNDQVDRTFRWAMAWFIFSEVCFFAGFFGALFYARLYIVPMLGGANDSLTHLVNWPHFTATWPLLKNPNNSLFVGANEVTNPWKVPALNTLILLTSGVTITIAHWGLKKGNHKQLVIGLICTVLLGVFFLIMQASEYHEAYTHFNLTLNSGIYGTTFFMLTGFHGLHVTIGTIMLIVITIRAMKHHFSPHNHFAFEGVAWYWHFVDVVWLFLFIFVYWL